MIIDTDILIWYLRGNERARNIIRKNFPFSISAVTQTELLQGARDKNEQYLIQNQLKDWGVSVLHINEAVSIRAARLVEDYTLSHSMELADALIAATALEQQKVLLTANTKHYRFVPGLNLQTFKP